MLELIFVVLHYLATRDTIECVDSIIKYTDTDKYKIIIVDNASPNDSFKKLFELYETNEKVILLHNESNLGFAKGNNVGVRYARQKFNPKYIVLLNNDICLFQRNLFSLIEKAYKDYNFAVLGPMIITKDGRATSNPKGNKILSRNDAIKAIKEQKKRYKLAKFHIHKITSFPRLVGRTIKGAMGKYSYEKINIIQKNVKLHGSFLVLSQEYMSKFDGLDERTFLYMEEDILFLHLRMNDMLSLYYPEISVFHKEDVSTEVSIGKGRDKVMFTTSNNIESLNVYLTILDQYGVK